MANRVQLLSSILLIINLLACSKKQAISKIPHLFVQENNADLQTKGGFLWYKGNLFSGNLINLYNSKDTLSFTPFWQGKEEGRAWQRYANGQIKEIRFFEKGHKVGKHQGWWENGKPKFVYHFQNDVYEGSRKEWYKNGKIFIDFNYQNGQEAGSQKAWFENGKIKANYVIKEGRQYGFIGVKNCNSIWKKNEH